MSDTSVYMTVLLGQDLQEVTMEWDARTIVTVLSGFGGLRVTLIVVFSSLLLPYQLFSLDTSLLHQTYYEDLRDAPPG